MEESINIAVLSIMPNISGWKGFISFPGTPFDRDTINDIETTLTEIVKEAIEASIDNANHRSIYGNELGNKMK